MNRVFALMVGIAVAAAPWPAVSAEQPSRQIALGLVERMPNIPQPFHMIDWKARARGFDRLAFNLEARGQYLPLVKLVEKPVNMAGPSFVMPAYVGAAQYGGEGIGCLAAVVGGALVGLDKSRPNGRNWVAMCQEWFNEKSGQKVVLNGPMAGTGGSAWYELLPSTIFFHLADRYPSVEGIEPIMRSTADRWCEACRRLTGPEGKADFDWTGFDLIKMQPHQNGRWREPDAAAGIGWIEYMAWAKWREPRYLEAARLSLDFLERRKPEEPSPLYEVMLYYAPVLAARMNAEAEGRYDVEKLLNWCISENRQRSRVRQGWGIIAERFGQYDCHGLQGSTTDGGGYAFAMSTFHAAGMVTPLVRYDPRFARAIGKWILNLANAARLFYPDGLPEEAQSCPGWQCDPPNVVAYEGLRKTAICRGLRQSPCALGDPLAHHWGPKTDYGVYGASHVGYLAALIQRTRHEHILQLDLLATDFFHDRAYPTFLYFNPDGVAKEIEIDVGPAESDLYETTTHGFVARGVRGKATFTVSADSAVVVVVTPAGGKLVSQGRLARVDGVVVDYGLTAK